MRQLTRPARSRAAGFTLVEVLITIVVSAVGLLTVAGLQAASKKLSYETAQRTLATALAQDMVERIRANAGVKASYVTGDATAVSQPASCSGASATCTPTALAADDVWQWGQKLLGTEERDADGAKTGGLVLPTGCVTQDSARGVIRVVVAWRGFSNVAPRDSSDPLYDSCGVGNGRYASDGGTGDETMRRYIMIEFV